MDTGAIVRQEGARGAGTGGNILPPSPGLGCAHGLEQKVVSIPASPSQGRALGFLLFLIALDQKKEENVLRGD